ncbi:MAG: hypothetical protein JW954_08335 [Dehalococcoidaceae bacterium]|nr:hypothetical protein [Dehalococcoidaceae bacterium]
MARNNKDKDAKAIDEIMQQVSSDPGYIQSLIMMLGDKGAAKFAAAKKLQLISRAQPSLLYPNFEVFAKLLDSTSSILLWNGIIILSYLVSVDTDKRFDNIFEKYYGLLWSGKLITAANILASSGRIARCRPDLAQRITDELLKVSDIPLPTSECREVARGHVLSSLAEYLHIPEVDQPVLDLIVHCTLSRRQATRKKAEELLNRTGQTKSESR